MILTELTNRIKNAQYLDKDEKIELLADLPNLNKKEIERLNNIFINSDNEFEVLTQTSDFAIFGVMEALITMNNLELKNQSND